MPWSPDCVGSFVKRVTALVVLAAFASHASAGPREQAKRMHDRIAGVPPSAAVLDAMAAEITAGRADDAALIAMDNPAFYSVTLKNLVTPWTNREQTVFAPLNDYTATVIGMVRDDLPFNELLSADVLYVGNAGSASRRSPQRTTRTTKNWRRVASTCSRACSARPSPAFMARRPRRPTRFARLAGIASEAGDRRHAVWRQPGLWRQHDGREHQSGDSRRRGKGVDALKEKVAPTLGVDAASLVAAGGRVHVKDNPSRGVSWADACKQIGPQPIAVDGDWVPGLSSVTTSGVQFAEVTVDVETGITKVTRILAIQDCGLVVSRLTAESQCFGGVIGSLNFAMFEDRILDRNTGQMVNLNMEWYLLAGMSDMPRIDVRLKDQPERGVIGIGEPPTVPTAAAIALAVRNAIGVSIRGLPLTPARILNALRQQNANRSA